MTCRCRCSQRDKRRQATWCRIVDKGLAEWDFMSVFQTPGSAQLRRTKLGDQAIGAWAS